MKTLKITVLLLFATQLLIAQNATDYLRYSTTYSGGSTARSAAMGGSFGAIGTDFSNLSTNPAGMGLYKKSDILFTPSIYISNVTSDFGKLQGIDNKSNFNIGSVGIVLTGQGNKDKWNFIQFGFGLNRINNFNNNINIQAENSRASLISIFQDRAYGQLPDDLDIFSTKLAWDTYLFDDTTSDLAYTSYLYHGGTKQTKQITSTGAMNEMVISFSGSYQDKFYLGGTIGFPTIKYKENSSHIETDEKDTIASFKKFIYDENLTTTGNGFNLKLGMIFRPIDWIRLGIAFHSPTYFNMKDQYQTSMTSYWDNSTNYNSNSDKVNFNYELTTPSKYIGSIAITFQKIAIINADVEIIDYSTGYFSSTDASFNEVNNSISDSYKTALNLRTGAEVKLEPITLRIGYGYSQSPYASNLNDGSIHQYSGGIGFKDENYYIDFAYVYTQKKEDYYLYDRNWIDPANLSLVNHKILITMGAKF
jgi:hypothetical protein